MTRQPCFSCGTRDIPRKLVPLRVDGRQVFRPFCQFCIDLKKPDSVPVEEIVHRAILDSKGPEGPM
jgi:hypothetical protein